MSGLEILGAIAAVPALVDGAKKLKVLVNDVRHGGEERANYQNLCNSFLVTMPLLNENLKLLRERKNASQDQTALYYEGLFVAKETSESPSIGKQQGSLMGLDKALEDMAHALNHMVNDMAHELRERHGVKKFLIRFTWPIDKEKLADMLRKVQLWKDQVATVLQAEQVEMAVEQLKKLSVIEANSRYDRERKEKKDRIALHTTIADWVSRLDFNGRHSEVQENCIDISDYLTSSLEFKSWQSGRDWILFCHAEPGAGKV